MTYDIFEHSWQYKNIIINPINSFPVDFTANKLCMVVIKLLKKYITYNKVESCHFQNSKFIVKNVKIY